ncbi:MAG: GGDEF domain-containing protein, partial [Desulfobacteraceae bacterium]|nr:GGDEF domain-containing protein [Desulfobacteraceae bacterium]
TKDEKIVDEKGSVYAENNTAVQNNKSSTEVGIENIEGDAYVAQGTAIPDAAVTEEAPASVKDAPAVGTKDENIADGKGSILVEDNVGVQVEAMAEKQESSKDSLVAQGDRYFGEEKYSEALPFYKLAAEAILRIKIKLDAPETAKNNSRSKNEIKDDKAVEDALDTYKHELDTKLRKVDSKINECYIKLGDPKKAKEYLSYAQFINPGIAKQASAKNKDGSSPVNTAPLVPVANIPVEKAETVTSFAVNKLVTTSFLSVLRNILEKGRNYFRSEATIVNSQKKETGVGVANLILAPPIEVSVVRNTNRTTTKGGTNGNHTENSGYERNNRRAGKSIRYKTVTGNETGSDTGDVKFEKRFSYETELKGRLNTDNIGKDDQAKFGVHPARAPPFVAILVISAVVLALALVVFFTIITPNNPINLTKPLTLSVVGELFAANVVKGGVLCVLSMLKRSGLTTSSTSLKTTLLSLQPARAQLAISEYSSSMMLPAQFIPATAARTAGKSSSALNVSLSVLRSLKQEAAFRSIKSTEATTTNNTGAGYFTPALGLVDAISSSPIGPKIFSDLAVTKIDPKYRVYVNDSIRSLENNGGIVLVKENKGHLLVMAREVFERYSRTQKVLVILENPKIDNVHGISLTKGFAVGIGFKKDDVVVIANSGEYYEIIEIKLWNEEILNVKGSSPLEADVITVGRASSPVKTIKELEDENKVLRAALQVLRLENIRLKDISRTDALTELPNRRDFDETISGMISNANRPKGMRLVFALIDIDFFGVVNNIFGHTPNGDEVLKSFAKAVEKEIRPVVDYVARYGGEEFGLLLTDVDTATAKTKIIDRCSEAVRSLEFPELQISLAVGVIEDKIREITDSSDREKMRSAIIHQLFVQGLIDKTGKEELSKLTLEELPYNKLEK